MKEKSIILKGEVNMKDITISKKDLRKAAFAVGFGLTLGKQAARWLEVAVSAAFGAWMVNKAEKGDTYAQTICKQANINYDNDNGDTEGENPEE